MTTEGFEVALKTSQSKSTDPKQTETNLADQSRPKSYRNHTESTGSISRAPRGEEEHEQTGHREGESQTPQQGRVNTSRGSIRREGKRGQYLRPLRLHQGQFRRAVLSIHKNTHTHKHKYIHTRGRCGGEGREGNARNFPDSARSIKWHT